MRDSEKPRSETERYTNLVACLFQDASDETDVNLNNDLRTIQHRIRNEGLNFLRKTLRSFGKAIDHALLYGNIFSCTSFKKYRKKSVTYALPSFLIGLTKQVFDMCTGKVRYDANVTAIRWLRQISYFFSKEDACKTMPEPVITDAIEKFHTIERTLTFSEPMHSFRTELILREGTKIITNLLKDFPTYYTYFIPRMGPGAVAERTAVDKKYLALREDNNRYQSVERRFPFYGNAIANANDLHNLVRTRTYKTWKELEPEGASEFMLVPKDSRGPRTITIEPLAYQFYQQGVREKLVPFLEKTTDRRINFADQSINNDLARLASLPENSNRIGTIDLEDASDRVTNWLVERLFSGVPQFLDLISSIRTRYISFDRYASNPAVIKHGSFHAVKRFAGMGSGLCFPIEALCFYAISTALINLSECSSFTRALGCHVYGDDIIVGSDIISDLSEVMSELQLKVNPVKTLPYGFFKESCGGDYWLGHDVTPLKPRYILPQSWFKPDQYLHKYTAVVHNTFEKAMYNTAAFLNSAIKMVAGKYKLHISEKDSPYIGLPPLPDNIEPKRYWCKKYQRYKVYEPVWVALKTSSKRDHFNHIIDDGPELFRKLTVGGNENFQAGKYESRSGYVQHQVRYV